MEEELLFEGRNYFKYFRQRGVIIWGMQGKGIIQGNTVSNIFYNLFIF